MGVRGYSLHGRVFMMSTKHNTCMEHDQGVYWSNVSNFSNQYFLLRCCYMYMRHGDRYVDYISPSLLVKC